MYRQTDFTYKNHVVKLYNYIIHLYNTELYKIIYNYYKLFNVNVTNDWSEARVDPLAALLVQGKGQTGKYQAVLSRAT